MSAVKQKHLLLVFCVLAQLNLFAQTKQNENRKSPVKAETNQTPQAISDSFKRGIVGVTFFKKDENGENVSVGSGTGFVVAKNRVLTCYHVPAEKRGDDYFLENYESIEVVVFDTKHSFFGKIVAFDKEKDLLLVEVASSQKTPFNKKILLPSKKNPSEDPKMTFFVFAFGSIQISFRLGEFKGYINDEKLTGHKKEMGMIQKAVTPGFSGGPVLDENGEWLGVVRASWDYKGGLTLFVPQNQVLEFLDEASKNLPQR